MNQVNTASPVVSLFSQFWGLSKYQKGSLVAGAVTAVGGAGTQLYQYFLADPTVEKAAAWNAEIPWKATVIGGAFVLMFILCFFMRKWMFKIGAAVVLMIGGWCLISYFLGYNVDFTSAGRSFTGVGDWAGEQVKHLTGVAWKHPGGAATSIAGAWMGFSRKKTA